jgi:hypothetical protein
VVGHGLCTHPDRLWRPPLLEKEGIDNGMFDGTIHEKNSNWVQTNRQSIKVFMIYKLFIPPLHKPIVSPAP